MKQDSEGQKLFRQIVDETPEELKTQLRFSDSIAEKLSKLLEERGMTQRDLARKVGKRRRKCRGGLVEHIISRYGRLLKYQQYLALI